MPLTDEMIEDGADLSEHIQNLHSVPAGIDLTPQKVNIDFPAWVVAALDHEASRIGVPRQSMVKMWVVDRLERVDARLPAAPAAAPVLETKEGGRKRTRAYQFAKKTTVKHRPVSVSAGKPAAV